MSMLTLYNQVIRGTPGSDCIAWGYENHYMEVPFNGFLPAYVRVVPLADDSMHSVYQMFCSHVPLYVKDCTLRLSSCAAVLNWCLS